MSRQPPLQSENVTDDNVLDLARKIARAYSNYAQVKSRDSSKHDLDLRGENNLDRVIGKLWALEEGPHRNMLFHQLDNVFSENKNNIYQFNHLMISSGSWKGMGRGDLKFQEGRTGQFINVSQGKFTSPHEVKAAAIPPDVGLPEKDQPMKSFLPPVSGSRPSTGFSDIETAQSFRSGTSDINTQPGSRPSSTMSDSEISKATRIGPSGRLPKMPGSSTHDLVTARAIHSGSSDNGSRPSSGISDLVTARAIRSGSSVSAKTVASEIDEVVDGKSSIFNRSSSLDNDNSSPTLPPKGKIKAFSRLGEILNQATDDSKNDQTKEANHTRDSDESPSPRRK